MNKKNLIIALCITLFLSTSSPVAALEIILDSTGRATFYNDGVLGDSVDDEHEAEEEREQEHEQEREQEHQDESAEKQRQQEYERTKRERELDAQRRKELQESERKNNESPLKVVSPQEKKEIRIRQTDGEYEVRLRDKNGAEQEIEDASRSARLRVELRASSREDLTEEELEEIGGRNAQQKLEERRARIGEKIELKQSEDGTEELELKSRDVAARIANRVDISIDPETNELSVINQNGEVIKVIHLPDQAITRMQELGALDPSEETDSGQLEIDTNSEGQVVYKLIKNKKLKLFGLFNREVETEVELNDETGLTEENTVERGGFQGFLDRLSF